MGIKGPRKRQTWWFVGVGERGLLSNGAEIPVATCAAGTNTGAYSDVSPTTHGVYLATLLIYSAFLAETAVPENYFSRSEPV